MSMALMNSCFLPHLASLRVTSGSSRFLACGRKRWSSCCGAQRVRCACAASPRNWGDEHSMVIESNNLPMSMGADTQDKPGSDVLIECRDVHKSFGEKQILRGVSFKIRHGEAVGIIGPSGTGKSTVLKIMAGLLAPDKGEVYICGRRRQGLVDDEEMSGLRIGLGNEDRFPSEMSGGMKKRVALARSIIFDKTRETIEPEVLLYDEPTAGLDPIASTVVEDLIRSVHLSGKDALEKPGKITSYVVVTHQHSTIRRAVDRLLFLYDGKIIWEGMTHEFTNSTNPIVQQFASGSLDGPIKY